MIVIKNDKNAPNGAPESDAPSEMLRTLFLDWGTSDEPRCKS